MRKIAPWLGGLLPLLLLHGCGSSTSGSSLSTDVTFSFPGAICGGSDIKIYLASYKVLRFDDILGTNGVSIAFGPGTGNLTARGIFVTPAGKIFLADTGNNRICRMDDMTALNFVAFGKGGGG